jgi:hypothetical protein
LRNDRRIFIFVLAIVAILSRSPRMPRGRLSDTAWQPGATKKNAR